MIDLLDELEQCSEENIRKALEQDLEYQVSRLEEKAAHDRFLSTLNSEQAQLFDDFLSALFSTNADVERIHYQQGMKDMLAILKRLSS